MGICGQDQVETFTKEFQGRGARVQVSWTDKCTELAKSHSQLSNTYCLGSKGQGILLCLLVTCQGEIIFNEFLFSKTSLTIIKFTRLVNDGLPPITRYESFMSFSQLSFCCTCNEVSCVSCFSSYRC